MKYNNYLFIPFLFRLFSRKKIESNNIRKRLSNNNGVLKNKEGYANNICGGKVNIIHIVVLILSLFIFIIYFQLVVQINIKIIYYSILRIRPNLPRSSARPAEQDGIFKSVLCALGRLLPRFSPKFGENFHALFFQNFL